MTRHSVLLVPVTLILLITSCTKIEQPAKAFVIQACKSSMVPEPNVYYTLVMPPMLYETHKPGPKEQVTSQAWMAANEFVFRTALGAKVTLPASGVMPSKSGYLVRFDGKDNNPDRTVFVRGDLKAAQLIKR